MNEVDIKNGIDELQAKVINEVVQTAKRILIDEAVHHVLLINSIRRITAYQSNQLPHPAYKILDGSRDLELIGNKFQEIVDSKYCMLTVEVKISIPDRDECHRPAASTWIQFGDSFYDWEFYLWDKDSFENDYLVLMQQSSGPFINKDEDLRYSLESLISHIISHRSNLYNRL